MRQNGTRMLPAVARNQSNVHWVPFDKEEDAPFAPMMSVTRVLLVFEDGTDLDTWLSVYGVSEKVKMTALAPPGIELMCDDYADQIPYFAWIARGKYSAVSIAGKVEGRVIETMPLWKLKMWAQYMQNDTAGYQDTLRRRAV